MYNFSWYDYKISIEDCFSFYLKCIGCFFRTHLPFRHYDNRCSRDVYFLLFLRTVFFLCYLLPHLKCKRVITRTRIGESTRVTSPFFLCWHVVHGESRSIYYVIEIVVAGRRKKSAGWEACSHNLSFSCLRRIQERRRRNRASGLSSVVLKHERLTQRNHTIIEEKKKEELVFRIKRCRISMTISRE